MARELIVKALSTSDILLSIHLKSFADLHPRVCAAVGKYRPLVVKSPHLLDEAAQVLFLAHFLGRETLSGDIPRDRILRFRLATAPANWTTLSWRPAERGTRLMTCSIEILNNAALQK